ncbi:oligosaccharide flippase family protein [Patescibacteria group bacterium]|nr:oligosaccharide flippase family protein [Patescibacteria group bacterium]
MGYSGVTIRGLSWLGAFRLLTRTLSFFRTIIIARILSPFQFGTYGIATLILAFIEIFTETGINVFLIQKKEGAENYINTAWIVSITRGFLISTAIILSAKYVSVFFKNPAVLPLLISISIVPFIRGFINPSIIKFQKELNFNREFYYRSSIFIVEIIVSILLILIIKNPIALIDGIIAGAIFEVIISFMFVRPVPSLGYSRKFVAEILSNGKWITSNGVLSYLFQNGDNVVVGKLLGAGSLGIYDMIYNISLLPVNEISDIIARITFPVYMKISEDIKRLKRAYIMTSILTMLLAVPILLFFLFFSKELILLILGPKWVVGENLLKVLVFFAFLNTLNSPTGALFLAIKKQKYLTLLTAIGLGTMIVSIVPLINIFGLVGAAISVVISSIIVVPFEIYFVIKALSKT